LDVVIASSVVVQTAVGKGILDVVVVSPVKTTK
jgi:hypothetical protein